MIFRRYFILAAVCLLLLPSLTGEGKGDVTTGGRTYFVSILPQAYLLEQMGGDRITVKVMVPPGKSPATYEPTPRQVMELGTADGFFTLGVPFERNFLSALESTLPDLPLLDASRGIERRMLDSHHHDEEEEEGVEEHHEEGGAPDPHIWLSPVLAQEIARNMAAVLIADDSENEAYYSSRLEALISDLEELDRELQETLAPLKGETLFVYHPSFGYFADRYGLHQEAIETGGREPSPADLERIIISAREEGVRAILVQPEFSQSSAQAVAQAIGGVVIPVETLNGDYANNLRNLAQELRKGLQ